MKKVAAFTLLELLVTLLLSSILFSLIFLTYQLCTREFERISNTSSTYLSISTLQATLAEDFSTSSYILVNINENKYLLKCKKDSSDIDYYFYSNKIVRQQSSRSDTVFFETIKPSFYFDNLRAEVFPAIVDELHVEATVSNDELYLYSRKLYSSAELLKLNL